MGARLRARRGGMVVVAAWSLGGVAAVLALAGGIDDSATATEPAVRGVAFQATDTLPPPPGCRRVVVIGDSLMDNARPWLVDELREAGYEFRVDAQPSRRIPERVRAPYSGVKAARSVRASFGEADCWMIALGSNDLVFGAGDRENADAAISEMLAAVSPGALVWWVNVNYHRDPSTSFDFPGATRRFNEVLAGRAAADPDLFVIDWYTLSEANLDWFFDPVHVDYPASAIRARFTVGALAPARP